MNNYDLFLFDMDGTLVNTENLHHMAYNKALSYYNIRKNDSINEPILELTFNEYCKYAHFNDTYLKDYVMMNTSIPYEKIYSKKKEFLLELLDSDLKFIEGSDILLATLFKNNIDTCIVTHSDKDVFNKIVSKLPLLKSVKCIVTKNDCLQKKPNPECYIKALKSFPNAKCPIGFEDSYKGYMALDGSNSITSVFIGDSNYYYYNKIKPVNTFYNFSLINWQNIIQKVDNYSNFTNISIDKYIQSLNTCRSNFKYIIKNVISLIKNCKKNIYLTGIGKCGHICKKSVSSWQSVGISCQYICIPDLFHGDFGILRDNDIIIYISNSGNTDELIECCKYIKNKFNILQICLTLNTECSITNYVNFHYAISSEKIQEIDTINMTPSTSSMLFLSLLDMIGIKLGEENGLTIEKFKLNHPGGSLGKVENNKIDYIVIVASGAGSRLFPLTKYIPKILITFNNKPFIQHMIEYWQVYCKNIIIISKSEHTTLIKYYTDSYFNIKILNFDQYSGTADTIYKTITNEYYNKNILFTWCDILPNVPLNINEQINNNIIFTFGNECRYGIIDNSIKKMNNGNIIGMYYINRYQGIPRYTEGDDICDVFINNFKTFSEYNLTDLIDIGDMNKLAKYTIKSLFKTRFFNEIIKSDNGHLLKKAVNQQGNDIITKEINWYKQINNEYSFIPYIYAFNQHSYEMEELNAHPLCNLFGTFTEDKQLAIINNILNKLDDLHSNNTSTEVSPTLVENDLRIECYDKVILRLSKIKNILEYFGNVEYVNGLKINLNINDVLEHCFSIVKNNINGSYKFIHGDCQFSNILYDESKDDIYFIDPRGYFGNTLLNGIPEYDYAKILYALTGYDEFNNNDEYFIDDSTINSLNFKITNYEYLFQKLPKTLYNKCTMALTIIIWLSLAQYNSNNILKCVTSYYHGLYLYKKYFNFLNN
jgi:D-arabinose 5-phosphate isomerase GutQ/beta-phosphoglucomutase-like phosphatase (HAD superfamily)